LLRLVLLPIMLSSTIILSPALAQEFKQPNWSTSDNAIDLAISADGSIVVVATLNEVRVYNVSGSLLWSWSQENIGIKAVDVSDDGNVVVAAIYRWGVYFVLFWKNAKTLSGNPQPSWESCTIWGWMGAEALALSGDGNHIILAHAPYDGQYAYNVSYWNNTLELSGTPEQTWSGTYRPIQLGLLLCADISYDGDIVAVLMENKTTNIFAVVYRGCKHRSGSNQVHDLAYDFGNVSACGGIALSDDGRYVVVGVGNTIYFFNTTMSSEWEPQWTYELDENERVAAVDISSDGDTVVAVTNILAGSPSRLLIFQAARSKTGIITDADKEFTGANTYTGCNYIDVSVDGLGMLAAGGTGDCVFAVNATTGELLWYYKDTWPKVSRFVEVSKNGLIVATAGEEGLNVIPEYPSVTALVTLLILATSITALTKKKQSHKSINS